MKTVYLVFLTVMILTLVTILMAWLQAYVIDPLLYKPRIYPENCTLVVNCTAEGVVFPRIDCWIGYYGSECGLRNYSEWYRKLD